ncbi:Coiled-coil and C2 domain-containing protein 1B [Dissophora ornata]|nr:Coiled-coil and C2 domain-containing protein 1B [Dissophora ornata]
MFSWKKQNPPSQQRQQRQTSGATGDYSDLIAHGMHLANEDIDHGDGDDDMGEDLDEDLGDVDLDDPELLAELQGLTGEAPAPRPKPAASQPPPKAPTPAPAPAIPARQTSLAKPPSTNTRPPAQLANKPSPSTTPAAPASLAGLGLDIQDVMEDNDDEEVELTEDDWNDPHLLAQLQSFGSHGEHRDQKAPAATRTAAESAVNTADIPTITHVTQPTSPATEPATLSASSTQPTYERQPNSASSSMIAIPPSDNAFNDEDMDGDSFTTEQQSEEPMASGQHTASSPKGGRSSKRLEEIPKKNDEDLLKLLQNRELQYKRAALEAHRAGNMALAGERVKMLKSLQSWIRLVEAGGFLDLELYPIPDEPQLTVTSNATSSSASAPSTQQSKAAAPASEAYAPPVVSAAPETTTHVSNSIAEASAEDMRSGSTVRGSIAGGIEFKQLAADDDFKIVSNSDDDTYDMLESQLESQIKMCTTTCAYYYQTGDKQTALEFHKLNKIFKTDLVSLQSYRTHRKKAPAFHFQDARFEVEVGFYQEIGMNDLSLSVVRAWDLSHKDVQPADIEAYVAWDLGWPTENMSGTGNGKGATPTVKRTSKPDFNYSKMVGIERTRAFQRFVERRKVTFEVWHYRGLLWKDYLIGRAQVPLVSLMNHSEIHEIVPLLDPTTRRNTGGKIEIKIRLQRPLLKPEIVVKEEKWLVIDEFNSGGLGFPTPVAATTTPSRATASPVTGKAGTPASKPNKPNATPAPPVSRAAPTAAPAATVPASAAHVPTKQTAVSASTSAAAAPKVSAAAPAPAATAAAGDSEESESDKALNELNNVDLLVSNMVLEQEIQQAQQMIHDARAVGNNDSAEEYQDRLTQLEIKMKLLVIQVQTGRLTMDMYCQAVNARIAKDKKLAVEFKRLGMLPEAKRALARFKTMAQEMKEVEEAMAAQGEDEE